MDGPLGRGFDSPHLQKTEIQPCVGSLFLFVGKGSRNEASGKSRAGAGFCSEGGFWRTTSSQKRLPPPPYCRSVFATIAHNRTTFLLFTVYKQVTQAHYFQNLVFALILHDSQERFPTIPGTARN